MIQFTFLFFKNYKNQRIEIPFYPSFSPVRYFDFRDLVGIVDAITGWETSLFELCRAGERRTALFRLFNGREGMTPADDSLPDRYFNPIERGPKKGFRLDRGEFEEAKQLYYRMAGCNETKGVPTDEKLLELGMVNDALHA